MLFAVCVAAGLVALVAGQSMNPMKCQQGVQDLTSNYTQSISRSVQDLTRELSKAGTDAMQLQGFTNDVNTLMDQMNQLADNRNGFDLQRMISVYNQILQTQMKLGRYFMNTNFGFTAMRAYFNWTSKMMQLNSDYFMSISRECMPTNGAN